MPRGNLHSDTRSHDHSTSLILGAGAMGRLWAAHLPPGLVAFVPRPGSQPGKPCEYQLTPVSGSPREVSVPWYPASPEAAPGVLLVTTKAPAVVAALRKALPKLPRHLPLVLFQNGMGSQEEVLARFPDRAVLAASTTEGANRPSPDSVIHAGRGVTWLGGLNETGRQALTPVLDLMRLSGLEVREEADIRYRLWQKLVINAGINAFTALLDCRNGDILHHDFFQENIGGLCDEMASLMNAEGMNLNADGLRQQIESVALATAANSSSMRSDIRAGRSTEIDYINGYIAKACQGKKIPAPVNQMLTDRVKTLSTHQ